MPAKPPPYWQHACANLSKQDKTMANLIRRYKGSVLSGSGDAFITLCRAIVGQQISLQAADSVWAKLEARCAPIEPLSIARRRATTLAACGLSKQKIACIQSVAKWFLDQQVTADYWQALDEVEIRESLCSIKGIGKWTYEMFAIFYLHSPNILPINDLGLIRAIEKVYAYETQPDIDEINRLAARWEPWRTVATWYLWRSVDPDPIVY